MTNLPTPITPIDFIKAFKEVFSPAWRYIVFYGGRSSGKSRQVALGLVIMSRKERLRILCTREIQNTIKDSVHKLLKDIIESSGFADFEVTNDTIRNTITGSEFLFRGMRGNTTEIKSMEGIDICWVEEAQSLSESSIDILTPTIRKPGSRIIFTFNRLTELDPVYVKFVLNPPPRTYAKLINFEVLEKYNLLPDVIKEEIEHDRLTNPEAYAHKWLGEPLSQQENSAIARGKILSAMQREVEAEGRIELGVDVARYGSDRTVLWKRKGLKTMGFKVYEKLGTPEVCDKVEQFLEYRKTGTVIKVDDTGVGGGVTDELVKRGYSVTPVNFGANPKDKDKYDKLISEAWFYLESIIETIQLPFDRDLLMELASRLWAQDTKGRRCIESKQAYKDRGFRSPDLADACILAYYNIGVVMEAHSDEEKVKDAQFKPQTAGLRDKRF